MAEESPKREPQSSLSENAVDSGDLRLHPHLEERLLNRVIKDYDTDAQSRTEWLKKKKTGLKLLWGQMPKKEFPFKGSANLNVPLIRTLAETLHANLHGSFDNDHPYDAIPVGQEDVAKAERVSKFLNWQFKNEVRFNQLLDHVLDYTLTYGHAVAKVRYVRETRKNKTPVDTDVSAEAAAAGVLLPEGELESEDEVLFDGVKVDILQPEHFLFPADAITSEVDELDHCIHEIPMSISDLNLRMASGMYRQSDVTTRREGTGQEETALKDVRMRHIGIQQQSETLSGKAKTNHRVLEWYGFFDVDEDGIEESVLVTIHYDSRQILNIKSWDIRRPFAVIKFSPIHNSPWGESVADLVGQINEELNAIHNQRMDSVTVSNIPYGFYDPIGGFDGEKIQLEPGVMIPTNGPPQQAVFFPTMQRVFPEFSSVESFLFAIAERLIGAGANTQGVVNPRRTSATEIATTDRRSGIRFFLFFSRIRDGMNRVGSIALELNQRLMPAMKQIRVMGANDSPLFIPKVSFDTFQRDELQGRFDLMARGQSVMDKNADKEEQLALYQLGIMNPLTASDPEAFYNLTKDTYKMLAPNTWSMYVKKPQFAVPQSPEDEHNRIAQGEKVDPVLGENVERHIQEHANFINSPQFQLLPEEAKQGMIVHFQNTLRMQQIQQQLQTLRQAQAAVAPPPAEENGTGSA